ncbi:MAG: MBL fold metallo-hydrolase [Sandaracinaceae bacterium]
MNVTTIDCDYLGREGFAAAYLIEDQGKAAFIETNTNHAVPRLLEALAAAGRTPEDVEFIVITHVHLDHAGGASLLMNRCPNATLLAHPRAARHAIDPSKLVKSAKAVYGEALFDELYGTIGPIDPERVRVMEDGDTATLGRRKLTFLHTRGHANHHACVLDEAASAIFTGDSFGVIYPHLQKAGCFAVPSTSPTDFDAPLALEALDRIVGSGAKTAYPTHFGGYENLDEIAGQLRAQLEEYGGIQQRAFDAGLEGEALNTFCDKEVQGLFARLLSAHGLADDPDARGILETDAKLNAQGVAFAVRRQRRRAER